MNIGFDAKRAFHNSTGLGNYSRTLIKGLARYFPEHAYYLFNPKPSRKYPKPGFENVHEVRPTGFISNTFSSVWRSNLVKSDLRKNKIELYHGLSHEVPVGINDTGIPSIVTMHDLIFERYPAQFKKIDVQIYRKKFRYACRHADRIIAISKQTRSDLVEMYGVDENKIDTCYQSCHPAFGESIDQQVKEGIRIKYQLPERFFLYVGSIIERKNLLNISKAYLTNSQLQIPLLVAGDGGSYKKQVQEFIAQNKLESKIIFLSDNPVVKADNEFQRPSTFAALYQMSEALVYPSFFEGFGLPVLEALWSRTPVITSNLSCLPETGGDAALYVDPSSAEEIGQAMQKILEDKNLREEMIRKGMLHAQNFTLEKCTTEVMKVYQKTIHA